MRHSGACCTWHCKPASNNHYLWKDFRCLISFFTSLRRKKLWIRSEIVILVSSLGFSHGIWFGRARIFCLLSVHLHTYLSISPYIHTKVYASIYKYEYIHIYTHTKRCTCTQAHTNSSQGKTPQIRVRIIWRRGETTQIRARIIWMRWAGRTGLNNVEGLMYVTYTEGDLTLYS